MEKLPDDDAENKDRWETFEDLESYFDWKSLATIENEIKEPKTDQRNGEKQG